MSVRFLPGAIVVDVSWLGTSEPVDSSERASLSELKDSMDSNSAVRRWIRVMNHYHPEIKYVDQVSEEHVSEFRTFQTKTRGKIREFLVKHGNLLGG